MSKLFDAGIIGAGIAGTSLAIDLRSRGHEIVLMEREQLPLHKVCGEYLSNESVPYLNKLGLETSLFPAISKLKVTSTGKKTLSLALDQGAIGISRHYLDAALLNRAKTLGVQVAEKCSISSIESIGNQFLLSSESEQFSVKTVFGAYGKKSVLDRNLGRLPPKNARNFVGVKYHLEADFARDTIWLHNFTDGYGGISAIENNRYCFCYLIDAVHLKNAKGNIGEVEAQILMKNSSLKSMLKEARVLPGFPVTISQITFGAKELYTDGVVFLGDAAGTIAPLTGNGMSIAFRSAAELAKLTDSYLKSAITKDELINRYRNFWSQTFANRIYISKQLQTVMGNSTLTNATIAGLSLFPALARKLVGLTHGKPF